MKKLKFRIKNWFIKTFIKRHLLTMDARLLSLFSEDNKTKKAKISLSDDSARKEYERIMKIISSEKYKKSFYRAVRYNPYRAVRYNPKNPEQLVLPFKDNLWDKILNLISIAYLYLFDKELYRSIENFEKWKNFVNKVDGQINEYMANTTLDEREDRAIKLGVVRGTAQKKLRNMQAIGVTKIKERNLL